MTDRKAITRRAAAAPRAYRIADLAAEGPVSQMPLHATVARQLREIIIQGRLKPGERIYEKELADYLAVSRTPLREALRILEGEGLIEHQPNRGARVSHITTDQLIELFEALAGIERICAELTAKRILDREIQELRALHEEMYAFHTGRDRDGYFELNDRIHRAIVELSENSKLVTFHDKLIGGAKRARYMAIQYPERWDESVEEHRQILAAIEARDAQRVGPLVERHVRATGITVCRIIGDEERRRL